MRFRLHKLLFGPIGKTQAESLDFGPFRFDDDLSVAFLRGSLIFTRLNESVLVQGDVETATTLTCVRSLEDFELCLVVPLNDIVFRLPGAILPLDSEDTDRIISDDGWIDLTETLREEILMAIPINPISPKYAQALDAAMPDGLEDADRDWLTVRWQKRALD